MSKKLIIVEGTLDRAVFETLLIKTGRATQEKIKSQPCNSMKLREYEINIGHGREGTFKLAGSAAHAKVRRILLALDLNSKSADQLVAEVTKKAPNLGKVEKAEEKYNIVNENTRTTVIPLGLVTLGTEWGIKKFTIDDYLFSLVLNEQVFNELKTQAERHGIEMDINHATAIRKLREIKALMEKQKLQVMFSKAYLEFFRGITGYIVSPPTFAERVITVCSDINILREIFANVLAFFDDE